MLLQEVVWMSVIFAVIRQGHVLAYGHAVLAVIGKEASLAVVPIDC